MHFKIKLNLMKLKSAYLVNTTNHGKSVLLPLKENELYFSDSTGGVYLQLKAVAFPQEWQTHTVKQMFKNDPDLYCGSMVDTEKDSRRFSKPKSDKSEGSHKKGKKDFEVDGLSI